MDRTLWKIKLKDWLPSVPQYTSKKSSSGITEVFAYRKKKNSKSQYLTAGWFEFFKNLILSLKTSDHNMTTDNVQQLKQSPVKWVSCWKGEHRSRCSSGDSWPCDRWRCGRSFRWGHPRAGWCDRTTLWRHNWSWGGNVWKWYQRGDQKTSAMAGSGLLPTDCREEAQHRPWLLYQYEM